MIDDYCTGTFVNNTFNNSYVNDYGGFFFLINQNIILTF